MTRLILFVLTISVLSACSTAQEGVSGWTTLFDGKSTDNIRGYGMDGFPDGIWKVENGALVTIPGVPQHIDLISKERYKDFDLELEWAVDKAANSGVFFHVQEDKSVKVNWLNNFEIQILDDINFDDKAPVRSAGSLYDVIIPTNKALMPIGQFNKARIKHKNGKVEHWLNGKKVLEFQIGSDKLKAQLANSKFKDNPNYHSDTEGHLMFQHHGQQIYLRNIRVRAI